MPVAVAEGVGAGAGVGKLMTFAPALEGYLHKRGKGTWTGRGYGKLWVMASGGRLSWRHVIPCHVLSWPCNLSVCLCVCVCELAACHVMSCGPACVCLFVCVCELAACHSMSCLVLAM